MPQSPIDVTRRTALAVFGASGAVSIAPNAVAAATSGKRQSLEKSVEALRLAMLGGDGNALNALLHHHLNYMHSSGNSQTKANLLGDLAGKRFFASLTYPDQLIDVLDTTGIVTQTVDQVKNLPDGKTRASRIKVLQTWLETGGTWKLLARSSAIIHSPLSAAYCPERPSAA